MTITSPTVLDPLLQKLDDRIMDDTEGSSDLTLFVQAHAAIRRHRKLLAAIQQLPADVQGMLGELAA